MSDHIISVECSSDNPEQVKALANIIASIAPFIVDNVDVTYMASLED